MAASIPRARVADRVRRALQEAFEHRLAEAALAQGLLTAERLAQAVTECGARGPNRRLSDVLVEHGWVDRTALDLIRADLLRDDLSRPSLPRSSAMPDEARPALNQPERQIGDFLLVALAGRGGAGEVWRAWDRRLERWVAVKIATAAWGSAAVRDRFEREARAVARLGHPNIVTILQTGVHEGRPYLVMPFIVGRSLDGVRLPEREALQIMIAAGDAVEHAHQNGVVHRDIKPGNLMRTRDDQVVVLDFGLAALREDHVGLTRPGDVLGTAAYMAPEQARGEVTTASTTTDVYALGATLYALVSGQAPFQGGSFAEVIARVGRGGAPSLRRLAPHLGRGLEAVVAKAMSLDAGHRYASARAFADDLRRLLAGEAPLARAPGPTRRIVQRVRRRPWVFLSIVSLVVLVLVVAAAIARARSQTAMALNTLRDLARVSLTTALELRRSGNMAGMQKVVPRMLVVYEQARELAPGSAEVEYLMGRLYREVLDESRAIEHQNRALSHEPDFAPALYERIVLQSQRYGRQLDRAWARARVVLGGAAADRASIEATPDLATLQSALLRDIDRLSALPTTETDARVARGILAFHQRRFREARDTLAAAAASAGDREELWLTLGRALRALDLEPEAEQAFSNGLARDRGFVPLLLARCEARARGKNRDGAIKDASAVLALDPADAEAHQCRAIALMYGGHDTMMSGGDPREAFVSAERDFSHVLVREPARVEAWLERGKLRRYRGLQAMRVGGEALPDLQMSDADLSRAIAIEPGASSAHAERGRTRTVRALARMRSGVDPLPDMAAAETDLAESLRLAPGSYGALHWRGDLRAHRAAYLAVVATGGPAAALAAAEPAMAAAESDFALPVAGGTPWALLYRGAMRTRRARLRALAGLDASADVTAAGADLDQAAHTLSGVAELWLRRAELEITLGLVATRPGDRQAAQARARVFAHRALAIDPLNDSARSVRSGLGRAGAR